LRPSSSDSSSRRASVRGGIHEHIELIEPRHMEAIALVCSASDAVDFFDVFIVIVVILFSLSV
jgi:hypothetical protein